MSRKASLSILLFSLILALALMAGMVWHRQAPDPDGPAKQMGVMVEVYEHINEDYVTTPDLAKVSDGALHGLVESLDADSSYLDPAQYKTFLANQANPPAGVVEAVISKRLGYADVVDVEANGNAAQAGLQRGDFVEAIEDQGTRDLSLEQIHSMLAGPVGSTITLSVVHLHRSDPVRITITRTAPTMAPLATSVDSGVGVIAVPGLQAGRTAQIAAALKSLKAKGAHMFILDLRDCGAGTYAEAESTANLFLGHGTITYLEGQRYPRVTTTAEATRAVDTADPLKLLVNSGTFGPAEVVAAALQQNGRAQVIGDHTFGEGSLQQIIPIGDGSAVWLSVARFYSPKGKLIQDGITPDLPQVRYAGSLPDLDFPPEGVTGTQPDLQLQKAMQTLAAAPATAGK